MQLYLKHLFTCWYLSSCPRQASRTWACSLTSVSRAERSVSISLPSTNTSLSPSISSVKWTCSFSSAMTARFRWMVMSLIIFSRRFSWSFSVRFLFWRLSRLSRDLEAQDWVSFSLRSHCSHSSLNSWRKIYSFSLIIKNLKLLELR